MGFLFVSFVGFRVSGAAGSFSEQVPQHQPHGSQRPCTWQWALQPLSVSSSLQSTFEASSLASEFLLFAELFILLVIGSVSPSTFRTPSRLVQRVCTVGYAYLSTDMSFTFTVKWSFTQLAV